MKKVIFLNAGHSELDPGAMTQHGTESQINIAIRDELINELEGQGFIVESVPDTFNLTKSIDDWVNKKAKNLNDGLALSIHCNCCEGKGAEAFHYKYNKASKKIAQALIDEYCNEMKMINRGAKSDTLARFGELSWIRRTNCWATLIECGFMDDKGDMDLIIGNFEKVARAICKGVCKIYGINYKEESSQSREEIKKQIIELVNRL